MASETTTGSNIDIAQDITVDYVVTVPGTRLHTDFPPAMLVMRYGKQGNAAGLSRKSKE